MTSQIPPFHPVPGAVLAGRYRVGQVLGRGGMGVVLEAQNVLTQRRVAIKWLHADLADNEEATERLIREASAASRISHPNVVDVYDVLQDGQFIFLIMELLEGEPLSALLERGNLSVAQTLGVLLPALHGVAEAHRKSVIHRDIHPGNIFLAREGRDREVVPKVLDFGISKLGGTAQPALTRSNVCMGTPKYMSYEQLCNARDVDARTDVYSFGVVLYEALTGVRPYEGESLIEVAGKIMAGGAVHPQRLRPELPAALADLVMWAMAQKAEQRVDSIDTLIHKLEPFAREAPARAHVARLEASAAHAPSARVSPSRRARRPPLPLLLAATLLIGMAGSAAWLARDRALPAVAPVHPRELRTPAPGPPQPERSAEVPRALEPITLPWVASHDVPDAGEQASTRDASTDASTDASSDTFGDASVRPSTDTTTAHAVKRRAAGQRSPGSDSAAKSKETGPTDDASFRAGVIRPADMLPR